MKHSYMVRLQPCFISSSINISWIDLWWLLLVCGKKAGKTCKCCAIYLCVEFRNNDTFTIGTCHSCVFISHLYCRIDILFIFTHGGQLAQVSQISTTCCCICTKVCSSTFFKMSLGSPAIWNPRTATELGSPEKTPEGNDKAFPYFC